MTLDGIDITSNTVGGGATAVNVIPTGVESLDEFKVGVTDANSTFGRSSGAQITLVSKGGGNEFHGDGYWFHQSDGYNANSWNLNQTPDKALGTTFTPKTPCKDNREGVSIGGPIIHDKTFFFSNYEVRRFPAGQTIQRIVPTSTLAQGILQFKDHTGAFAAIQFAYCGQLWRNGDCPLRSSKPWNQPDDQGAMGSRACGQQHERVGHRPEQHHGVRRHPDNAAKE